MCGWRVYYCFYFSKNLNFCQSKAIQFKMWLVLA